MRIALLCSGLGNVLRGHEVFARDLFESLRGQLDITLFKGGGEATPHERVIEHVPRGAAMLDRMHLAVSPKWERAAKEAEQIRIEGETFAHAALKPLLEGEFDVIHCLEQEVCAIVFRNRHLFPKTPKIVFSNGGAIPARDLPPCDFVQEHTEYNLRRSLRDKAFMIPHGVDLARFDPAIASDFRAQHGIPTDARVAISVGTIGYWHKRMDYTIREVAQLASMHLVIVGQECADTPAIKALGRELMGGRITFCTLPHGELPKAYKAADVFVLGSLFETFGIVYVEAMAMGLPVFCTNHDNQRSIVKEGVFIDMSKPGNLAAALRDTESGTLTQLGGRGREIAAAEYDLRVLKRRYVEQYRTIAEAGSSLPTYSMTSRVLSNLRNAGRSLTGMLTGGR